MPSRPQLPRETDLKRLPLRAIVAYAVRCARRVLPLYTQLRDAPDYERYIGVISRVLTTAEEFCASEPLSRMRDRIDSAAAESCQAVDAAEEYEHVMHVAWSKAGDAESSRIGCAKYVRATAALDVVLAVDAVAEAVTRVYESFVASRKDTENATNAVASAAANAACGAEYAASCIADASEDPDAGASNLVAASRSDYESLAALNLGSYPNLGATIDPRETGPLGPLWRDGLPSWLYDELTANQASKILRVNKKRVWALVRVGRLQPRRYSGPRRALFSREDVELLAQHLREDERSNLFRSADEPHPSQAERRLPRQMLLPFFDHEEPSEKPTN
jgi:hypothetical protein